MALRATYFLSVIYGDPVSMYSTHNILPCHLLSSSSSSAVPVAVAVPEKYCGYSGYSWYSGYWGYSGAIVTTGPSGAPYPGAERPPPAQPRHYI